MTRTKLFSEMASMKSILPWLLMFCTAAAAAQDTARLIEVPVDAPAGVMTLQQMLKERGSSSASNRRQTEFEVPVQALPGDFDVEKAMVFPDDSEEDKRPKSNSKKSGDLTRVQLGDGRIVNREISSSSSSTPPEFAPVTSNSVARLQLNPASMLQAAPGETTTVEFFLTNLGPRNYFTVLARESSSGFSARGGQGEFGFGESATDFINFPLPSFLAGLSEVKPYLDEGETRTIVLSIKVPLEAELGVRKVIFLEVQPFGNNAAGSSNAMGRRFYFAVESEDPSNLDGQPPECQVKESTFYQQCNNFTEPGLCEQRRWTARFEIQDISSGLRSITTRPSADYQDDERFYSHDNFIAGGQTPIGLLYAGSCCTHRIHEGKGGGSVTINVMDVAGNEASCSAGAPRSESGNLEDGSVLSGDSTTLTIVIAVCAAALLLVIIAAIIVIVVMKKKRAAELAEMRETPQAR